MVAIALVVGQLLLPPGRLLAAAADKSYLHLRNRKDDIARPIQSTMNEVRSHVLLGCLQPKVMSVLLM